MESVREQGVGCGAFSSHRRGDFVAVGDGVSFGGGQKVRRLHFL